LFCQKNHSEKNKKFSLIDYFPKNSYDGKQMSVVEE